MTIGSVPAPPEGAETPPNSSNAVRTTELIISYVLRGGVLLSAGIILAGVADYYLRYHGPSDQLRAERGFPHSLPAVASGLASGDPLALVALGLLVLLVTPVLRVAVSIVAFAVEGDWRYVVITAVVLVILIASFLVGKAAG